MGKSSKSKIMFVAGAGGHLTEILKLNSLFDKYSYSLVTEKCEATSYLEKEYPNHVYYLVRNSSFIHPIRLLITCFKSLYLYFKLRPRYIITTGPNIAGPMCCIGKLFGSKIIYIESFANISTKTLTGRLVYKFADLFLVQWESMLELYPKATYKGMVF